MQVDGSLDENMFTDRLMTSSHGTTSINLSHAALDAAAASRTTLPSFRAMLQQYHLEALPPVPVFKPKPDSVSVTSMFVMI